MTPTNTPDRFRLFPVAGGLLLLAAIGFAVWFAARSAKDRTAPSSQPVPSAVNPSSPGERQGSQNPGKRPTHAAPAVPDSGEPSELVAAILADQALSNATACRRLAGIVASDRSPLSERLEALDHLLILTTEAESETLVPLASSPRLPQEVRDRLFADAHNRSGKAQLEILLSLFERSDADHRADVLDLLRLLLGEDHGEDLAAWRVAIETQPTPPR